MLAFVCVFSSALTAASYQQSVQGHGERVHSASGNTAHHVQRLKASPASGDAPANDGPADAPLTVPFWPPVAVSSAWVPAFSPDSQITPAPYSRPALRAPPLI